MKTIDARTLVGSGFPPHEGERLADWLLAQTELSWSDLEFDVSTCPPALLISAFFNGFLQRIFENAPSRLDEGRRIKWKAQFEFQNRNTQEWIAAFKPFIQRQN